MHKVKLFKTYPERINGRYDSYYEEVEKLTVSDYSEWEEVDDNELYLLRNWCEQNKNFILIIQTEYGFSKTCIKEQIEIEKKRREVQKKIDLENKQKWEKEKLIKAEKKLAKDKAKLEKLKKEVEEKLNSINDSK